MSLIGLMIGMLLSVISVLAAMTMYHTLVDVAVDTKIDASHDGELATAMLTVQLELQNAGYGIDDAKAAKHLAIEDGNKLYWRYQIAGNSGDYTCRRLEYFSDATTAELRLSGMNGCTLTRGLTPTTPTALPEFAIAANEWPLLATLASFTLTDTVEKPVIEFSADSVVCFPYGRNAVTAHSQVTISAQSAANRANTAGAVIPNTDYVFCLPNLT